MSFESVEYRGLIISKDHLDGCFIYGEYFRPNGTGPEKLFGSERLGSMARSVLKSFKTDKWQRVASFAHDIMYKIGGSESDRKQADKLMRKIANSEVKSDSDLGFFARKIVYFRMWMNWRTVRKRGASSFNFTKATPELETIEGKELKDHYEDLVARGLIKTSR